MNPDTLTLRIDSLAFGGEAIGRDSDGRAVFVAGGAPGDLVRVRVTEAKKRFARADLLEIVERGASRIEAPCKVADVCGGCPWQHVAYAAQLVAKQNIVERALRGVTSQIDPIVGADAARTLGYRTRATLEFADGEAGFHGRRSSRIIAIEHCPALDPGLDRALFAAAKKTPGADGQSLSGYVDGSGAVQVLAPDVALPFQQANHMQNERLRGLVREALGEGPGRALELYCGDGNFTTDLAARAQAVVAVESDRAAVARLVDRKLANVTVVASEAVRATRELVEKKERFDTVLLDPPRQGAAEAMLSLAALRAPKIVYVSCDPMTLARDLGVLTAEGYKVTRATPIDMMPHTSHIEMVVELRL